MDSVLAIIPARGGSKRIPRKNIKHFAGRPIIAYSIESALQCKCFTQVMVSTDDEEIATISRTLGASIPFMRGSQNANDHAGLAEVILEVLDTFAERGETFPLICCLLPTAPFITAARLREAHQTLQRTGADAVIPVVKFGYPIQRALKLNNERLSMFEPENYPKRSQDLEPAYHDAGQFYWIKPDVLRREGRLFVPHSSALVLPETEVHDIDTEEDWRMAEIKYRALQEAAAAKQEQMLPI